MWLLSFDTDTVPDQICLRHTTQWRGRLHTTKVNVITGSIVRWMPPVAYVPNLFELLDIHGAALYIRRSRRSLCVNLCRSEHLGRLVVDIYLPLLTTCPLHRTAEDDEMFGRVNRAPAATITVLLTLKVATSACCGAPVIIPPIVRINHTRPGEHVVHKQGWLCV